MSLDLDKARRRLAEDNQRREKAKANGGPARPQRSGYWKRLPGSQAEGFITCGQVWGVELSDPDSRGVRQVQTVCYGPTAEVFAENGKNWC